jgi:flavin reductase (DIM6/NTAB) family NADH-FMN oxidoreductase RutF
MKEIAAKNIVDNPVELIGAKWMLVTAGTESSNNLMTASWGGLGFMWNKPVAFVVVRPNRYTHEFVEQQEKFTLSFLSEQHRSALKICGSHSGRDGNKWELSGLTPWVTDSGTVAVQEADLVIECRKMYKAPLDAAAFIDQEALSKWYAPDNPLHDLYIAEITHVWVQD